MRVPAIAVKSLNKESLYRLLKLLLGMW